MTERAKISEAEAVIRRLHEITIDHKHGFADQLRRLLQLGLTRFELDIGIVARIEGSTYTVVEAVAPTPDIAAGDTFDLGQTFCSLTLAAQAPIGFEHAGQTENREHPCYAAFGLEAYVGTPLIVQDKPWGTLNFSSATPREGRFRDVDIDALQLMAAWVSSEVERRVLSEGLKTLMGLIPICSTCKLIRDELGGWQRLEAFLGEHADMTFSHGMCPQCETDFYAEMPEAGPPGSTGEPEQ